GEQQDNQYGKGDKLLHNTNFCCDEVSGNQVSVVCVGGEVNNKMGRNGIYPLIATKKYREQWL
ncbi:MAG: hypothetical protein D6816_13545, partial [Bacteroidetes bacterium]